MRIPVLTYHASNIAGNTYATNNARALESDVRQLTDRGFEVRPLHDVMVDWLEDKSRLEGRRIACLTCDDGTDFDFHDLEHPRFGRQRSLYNVLADFRAERPGAQPSLNITSFVVVSPQARAALDEACLAGAGWWHEDWWAPAAASGLMDIANHSWDHHHDALPGRLSPEAARGRFHTIATRELADIEIRQAGEYLRSVAPNRGDRLFAYPYGEANTYLVSEYFPRHARELGTIAAFTTRPGFLSEWSDRWALPRFVFGPDWSSPEGLDRILARAESDD